MLSAPFFFSRQKLNLSVRRAFVMLASRLFSSLEIIHAGSLTVVCQKTQFSIITDLLFSVEAVFFCFFFAFFLTHVFSSVWASIQHCITRSLRALYLHTGRLCKSSTVINLAI